MDCNSLDQKIVVHLQPQVIPFRSKDDIIVDFVWSFDACELSCSNSGAQRFIVFFLIFCLPLHSESTDIKLGLISIQPNKSVSPSPGPADQLKK